MPEANPTTLTDHDRPEAAAKQQHTKQQHKRKKKLKKPHERQCLADYIPLAQAAEEEDMPSLRTLQRMKDAGLLPGLVYFGKRPFLNIPAFRAGLEARVLKAVNARRGRR